MKKNLSAWMAIRAERLADLCADYRKVVLAAERRAGGPVYLADALGMSKNYIIEAKRRGIVGLKKCAEAIAVLYPDLELGEVRKP